MSLAGLVLAALFLRAEVFPKPLCENLPEVSPEVKTWVTQVAPELAQVRVRELVEPTALDVFRRAAAAGWGSIDVLTDGVFREPCTFHLSQEALRAVDAAFDVNLLTAIRGQDRNGQDFEMTDILAGRGRLLAFYDRDGIVYRNEKLNRDFMLASRVEFDTPGAGVLENIHGLCAKVLLFGCVRVRSMVKAGETVEVRVGTFTSKTPLKPIQAWGTRSRSGRLGAPAPAACWTSGRRGPGMLFPRAAKNSRRGARTSRQAYSEIHRAPPVTLWHSDCLWMREISKERSQPAREHNPTATERSTHEST